MNLPPSSISAKTLAQTVDRPRSVAAEQPQGKAFSMSCCVATPNSQVSARSSPDMGVSEQATNSGVVDIAQAPLPDSVNSASDERYQNQLPAPSTKSTDSDSDLEVDDALSRPRDCFRCFHDPRFTLWFDKYDQDFLDAYQLTGEYKLNLHESRYITSDEERIKGQEKRFIAGDYGEGCDRELRSRYIKKHKQSLEKYEKIAELEGKYQQRFSEKDRIHIILFGSDSCDNVRLKPETVKKLLDEDPTIFDGIRSPHHLLPGLSSDCHPLAARYQPLARLIAKSDRDQSMIFEVPEHAPSCPMKKFAQDPQESSQALPDALTCWFVRSIPFLAYMNQCYKVNNHGYFQMMDFREAEYELLMKSAREKAFLDSFYRFLFGVEDSVTPMIEPAPSSTHSDRNEKSELTRLKAKFTLLKNMYPSGYDGTLTMDNLMDNFSRLFPEPSQE